MKNIFISFLLLGALSTPAFAAKHSSSLPKAKPSAASQLIARLHKKAEARKKKFGKLDTKLVRFFLSPSSPVQGQNVVVFAQIASRFENSDVVVEGTFDSAPVTLEKSAPEMWAYNAGTFDLLGDHTFNANVFVQDSSAALDIKNAISALDSDISTLNAAIAAETDIPTKNALIATRDSKIDDKNELIDALNGLKKSIASESITFSIAENASLPGIPYIGSVAPNFGPLAGGTEVHVSGVNFVTGMEVKLGGKVVSYTLVSPTEITFLSPSFSGVSELKDLEIKNPGPPITQSVRKNAYFPTGALTNNVRPVAVAGASQSVSMGATVNLSGSASYDENGDDFSYAWKAISVPDGSGFTPGSVYGTTSSYSFVASKPGNYVWELVLTETSASPALVSEPSLTVVTANPPSNTAPIPTAASITDGLSSVTTTQVMHGDVDSYQSHSYIITQQSALGAATISNTGLITFTSGSTPGSDSLQVVVADNGLPPLSASLTISVSVVNSSVTVDDTQMYYGIRAKDGLITAEMGCDVITSSGGTIVSTVWDFGDGTSQHSYSPDGDGYIQHDYVSPATRTVTLTATDSLGAVGSATMSLPTGTSAAPKVKVSADVVSGSAPLTVNFDASASSDDVAITSLQWRWGDGSSDEIGTATSKSHTYTADGQYRARIVARDADSARADEFIDIYVGGTPPAAGSTPTPVLSVGSREVVIGSNHTFSGADSVDPNPSGSIAAYRWNFNDYFNCDGFSAHPGCIDTGASVTHAYTSPYNYQVNLEVEGAGGAINSTTKEVYAVNSGHAPRAVVAPVAEGVAPFTATFDGSESFDYDGSIASYFWNPGDFSCTTGCYPSTAVANYTYTTDNVYWASLEVTDDDGNKHQSGFNYTVYPSLAVKKQNEKKARTMKYDPDRERLRHSLSQSCFERKDGLACYQVGKMYEADGNAYVSGKFYEKACAAGYTAACTVKR